MERTINSTEILAGIQNRLDILCRKCTDIEKRNAPKVERGNNNVHRNGGHSNNSGRNS